MKRERMRFQSRACPAGPEITSYSAAMMASMDPTSSGFAAGTVRITGCGTGAVWATASPAERTSTDSGSRRRERRTGRPGVAG
jgi:hypothetical protein